MQALKINATCIYIYILFNYHVGWFGGFVLGPPRPWFAHWDDAKRLKVSDCLSRHWDSSKGQIDKCSMCVADFEYVVLPYLELSRHIIAIFGGLKPTFGCDLPDIGSMPDNPRGGFTPLPRLVLPLSASQIPENALQICLTNAQPDVSSSHYIWFVPRVMNPA